MLTEDMAGGSPEEYLIAHRASVLKPAGGLWLVAWVLPAAGMSASSTEQPSGPDGCECAGRHHCSLTASGVD